MHARRLLLGLVVVPLLMAAGEATGPPAGWKEFSPKDQSFSVWLPDQGGRRSERERTRTVNGTHLKFNVVLVQPAGGPTYGAATVLLPPQLARKISSQQLIEILRDAFVEEVKGKVTGEKDIKQGLVPGKEYVIQTGRGLARLRLFAAGMRVYQATVAGSKAQVESKAADTFLGSYKLPEKVAATPPDNGKDRSATPPKKTAAPPPEKRDDVRATPPARADEALPANTLRQIKAATVFVKVQSGRYAASGSGFVFHVDPAVAYLATNNHVVMVPGRVIPRPRPLPPLRLSPRVGNVRVVFGSGTPAEREVPAQVVFRDAERDLALLKVAGVKDLPAPIPLPATLKLAETTPVYVFGYPFGRVVSDGKNPAATVGKGTVNRLQEDKDGQLAEVGIEAEVHPGNSGGPVVDARGQLVGVTVAKVEDTRLAMAIPATHLDRLMKGRFVEAGFYPRRLDPETLEVCVNMLVFDPRKQIQSARFFWLPPDVAAAKPRLGKDGLAGVQGNRSLDLEPGKTTWTGNFRFPAPEKGQPVLTLQILLVTREGEPQVIRATHRLRNPALTPEPSQRKPLAEGELARLKAQLGRAHPGRRQALEQLAAQPTEPRGEALQAIRNLLDDEDASVRESSVRALRVWAGQDALPDLLRRLKAEDFPPHRWPVIEELGQLKHEEAARAIAEELGTRKRSGFHAKALRAMGPVAEKPVLPLLAHKDATVRLEGCRILEAVGTKQSLAGLEAVAARDADARVTQAAQVAIQAINGRKGPA
jgi:S1-C subfamily serine protease